MDPSTARASQRAHKVILITLILVEFGFDFPLIYRIIQEIPADLAMKIVSGLFWLELWLFVSLKVNKMKPWPGWLAVAGGPVTVLLMAPSFILTGGLCVAGALILYMIALQYTHTPATFRLAKMCAMFLALNSTHAGFELLEGATVTVPASKEVLKPVAILSGAVLGPLGSICALRFSLMKDLEDFYSREDGFPNDLWPEALECI